MRHGGSGESLTGVVRGVERVPASEVADDVRFDATHAVVLAVDTGDQQVRALEAWPSGGHSSSRLARVLDAVGRGVDGPRALTDEMVVVERRDGVHRVAVSATEAHHATAPGERHHSHSLLEVGVGAGVFGGFAAAVAVLSGAGAVGAGLALVAAAVLPVSLWLDARRTAIGGWSPRATPWAVGGIVPVLNVAVAVAYLARKTVAIDGEGATTVWRDVLYGVVGAFGVALALAAVDLTAPVAAAVAVHAWVLAPLAVYLDLGSSRHGGRCPSRAPWVAGAAVVGGAGALVYLLKTA
jgi:hypothetical protein